MIILNSFGAPNNVLLLCCHLSESFRLGMRTLFTFFHVVFLSEMNTGATCSCWGDPHCETFDGKKFNYMGLCSHVLARDNCYDGGKPTFMVIAYMWKRNKINAKYTWIKNVRIITDKSVCYAIVKFHTKPYLLFALPSL